ncbi:Mor transcription activator family protein [Pectobacterium atrosepticum]|uniref:Mor transcription activator family protein n=1 Tax=Pectobacterium atrosepticum TaxID=29471 RepID=UPI001BFBFD85|nr:Mor transcription activator family protein [Pectobacterium atrosepticum]QWC51285.1 DNA-binding protein [Pectobacterium atrosepticum]
MTEPQFRSKGPELLVELSQHVADTVKNVTELDPQTAELVGNAVAKHMMTVWGGQNVYFPMGISWRASQRDLQIYEEFDGRNHSALAKKSNVSLQWIYKIVRTMRKDELQAKQKNQE